MWASGWGPDLVWMLRGRLGFILIEPTHPSRTTMVVQHFCAATCSRRRRKEEMEEIGRNGGTNYNTGSHTISGCGPEASTQNEISSIDILCKK